MLCMLLTPLPQKLVVTNTHRMEHEPMNNVVWEREELLFAHVEATIRVANENLSQEQRKEAIDNMDQL